MHRMSRSDRVLASLLAVILIVIATVIPQSHRVQAEAEALSLPKLDLLDHEAPSTTVAPTTTTTTTVPATTTTIEPPTTTVEPTTEATEPPTVPATIRRVVRTTSAPTSPPVTEAPTTVATESPAPAPVETPVPASSLCVSKYGDPSPDWLTPATILAAGWPESQVTNVCKIVGCESNFHSGSVARAGRSTEVTGLMQIMPRSQPWSKILADHGWTRDSLLDPMINLTVAHEGWALMGSVWSRQQWSCASVL